MSRYVYGNAYGRRKRYKAAGLSYLQICAREDYQKRREAVRDARIQQEAADRESDRYDAWGDLFPIQWTDEDQEWVDRYVAAECAEVRDRRFDDLLDLEDFLGFPGEWTSVKPGPEDVTARVLEGVVG